jgi:hypothetical protein
MREIRTSTAVVLEADAPGDRPTIPPTTIINAANRIISTRRTIAEEMGLCCDDIADDRSNIGLRLVTSREETIDIIRRLQLAETFIRKRVEISLSPV